MEMLEVTRTNISPSLPLYFCLKGILNVSTQTQIHLMLILEFRVRLYSGKYVDMW